MVGVAFLVLNVVLLAVATTTLAWMLDAWRTPETLERTRFGWVPQPAHRSFSLIVPARHEAAVLGATLQRMAEIDHPNYEVIVVIGHDDPETELVAQRFAADHPDVFAVVIDHNWPKNKPKALNTALPYCSGEIVGVFDAEDIVATRLLQRVETAFRLHDADVVQGGVQLMNFETNWWALRNCLEYFFYFRSRLHFHARQGFIPLGGNTVFFRRELLVGAGGWDESCLAEDCDIGVRLSTHGARVTVAYDPDLATQEETPDTLQSLFKQRTRWNQGFLQVLEKGEWQELPTRPQRLLARYTLAMPFLQAGLAIALPISILAAFFVQIPILLALTTFLPILVMAMTLFVEMAALGEFAAMFDKKARWRDYVRLTFGLLPYQMLLGAAAARAVYRQRRGVSNWEKTEHVGAHTRSDESGDATVTEAAA